MSFNKKRKGAPTAKDSGGARAEGASAPADAGEAQDWSEGAEAGCGQAEVEGAKAADEGAKAAGEGAHADGNGGLADGNGGLAEDDGGLADGDGFFGDGEGASADGDGFLGGSGGFFGEGEGEGEGGLAEGEGGLADGDGALADGEGGSHECYREPPGGDGTPAEAGAAQEELIASLQAALGEKERQRLDSIDKLQRCAAEFDNYKKRTLREKEALYSDAAGETIAAFLPILDNLERASASVGDAASAHETRPGGEPAGRPADAGGAAEGEERAAPSEAPLREGIALIEKQMRDILQKLGVELLPGAGEPFDPNCHDAVMHVEDCALGKNVVAEVFQKGYRRKDRIIRHSMVKVAN